jgi:hypothetical protein
MPHAAGVEGIWFTAMMPLPPGYSLTTYQLDQRQQAATPKKRGRPAGRKNGNSEQVPPPDHEERILRMQARYEGQFTMEMRP